MLFHNDYFNTFVVGVIIVHFVAIVCHVCHSKFEQDRRDQKRWAEQAARREQFEIYLINRNMPEYDARS